MSKQELSAIEKACYSQSIEIWGEQTIREKVNKLLEESRELYKEVKRGNSKPKMRYEVGDCLYILAHVCKQLDISMEDAMSLAIDKNQKRIENPNYMR